MTTNYKIDNVLKSSGYNSIIMIAYLFRFEPDGIVSINGIEKNNIDVINGGTGSSNDYWTYTIESGIPRIKLKMRKIYDNLSLIHSRYYIGKINVTGYSQTWYTILYNINSLTGIPSYSTLTKSTNSISIVADVPLPNEVKIYDNTLFGLGESSFCDNTILERKLVNEITIS